MTVPVLVTDGEQRASLAAVRSLGRAGYECHVVSATGRSLTGASRYAAREHRLADPLTEPETFGGGLERLVAEREIAVILPVTDASLFALLPRRERLAPARLPWPALEVVRAVADKPLVMEMAVRVGIGVPRQVVLQSQGAVAALAGDEITFPLIVKPARSVVDGPTGRMKIGVRFVDDRAGLERALLPLPEAAYPVMLQQRVVGPGIGVFLLVWQGQTRAVFSHRRLREKPPSGGISVYRESIAADPGLVAKSRSLLDAFGWEGVAMVEYKVDAATGVPYLMEINGRFWGSLQLAVDAGVDFPRLLVDLALGHDPGPPPGYRPGVRSRWWWGDVDHLLARLRRSRAELSLPPDAPSLGRAVAEFLVPWRPGDRSEILRLSDPLPSFRETVNWFRRR